MAEMVSSAVAQEVVTQVLSCIHERYAGELDAKDHMERMEMAHIKLEAALETSEKWNVTSAPLLRWKRKLKRAAQECNDLLRSCKQRLQEEEEMERRVRSSSFQQRIAFTARTLMSSIFNCTGKNELSRSTVCRFEWFADSASEFLRYVELGGTPRRFMSFDPLVRHLLAGKGSKYFFIHGSQHLMFFIRPFILPDDRIEAGLLFLFKDGIAPENNFLLGLHLRLSESTDIVGVTVRCMELFTPHLRSTTEIVKTKLTQLPMQDLIWAPYSIIDDRKEHWEDLHNIICQWSRPNSLCCQQNDHHYAGTTSNASSSLEPLSCDGYMEQVTQVSLQGHLALSACRHNTGQGELADVQTRATRDFPYLKLGGIFLPHAPSEDLMPAVGGSAIELIHGEKATERSLYANISFEQLGEIILQNAADRLSEHAEASSYQMLWKSKHGSSYLRVEKTSWATNCKRKGGKRLKLQGKKVQGWASWIGEFVNTWGAHAPAQLQGSIEDWVQKENKMPPIQEVVVTLAPTESSR